MTTLLEPRNAGLLQKPPHFIGRRATWREEPRELAQHFETRHAFQSPFHFGTMTWVSLRLKGRSDDFRQAIIDATRACIDAARDAFHTSRCAGACRPNGRRVIIISISAAAMRDF